MFYNLTYTLNGVRIVEECLTTGLLSDRIRELSLEHDKGQGHYVYIESVTPITPSLETWA